MTKRKNPVPGSCDRCGRRPPKRLCKHCTHCLSLLNRSGQAYKARAKAAGRCVSCGKPAAGGTIMCEDHRAKSAASQKLRWARAKARAKSDPQSQPQPPDGDQT